MWLPLGKRNGIFMERYAWKAIVKDGMIDEYVKRHNEIWPELTAVLK